MILSVPDPAEATESLRLSRNSRERWTHIGKRPLRLRIVAPSWARPGIYKDSIIFHRRSKHIKTFWGVMCYLWLPEPGYPKRLSNQCDSSEEMEAHSEEVAEMATEAEQMAADAEELMLDRNEMMEDAEV